MNLKKSLQKRNLWRVAWVKLQHLIRVWVALKANGWFHWPDKTTNTSLKSYKHKIQKIESRYFVKSETKWNFVSWCSIDSSVWKSMENLLVRPYQFLRESKSPSYLSTSLLMQLMNKEKVIMKKANILIPMSSYRTWETTYSRISFTNSFFYMLIVSSASKASYLCWSSVEDT